MRVPPFRTGHTGREYLQFRSDPERAYKWNVCPTLCSFILYLLIFYRMYECLVAENLFSCLTPFFIFWQRINSIIWIDSVTYQDAMIKVSC